MNEFREEDVIALFRGEEIPDNEEIELQLEIEVEEDHYYLKQKLVTH